jgi:hypothetical protein
MAPATTMMSSAMPANPPMSATVPFDIKLSKKY